MRFLLEVNSYRQELRWSIIARLYSKWSFACVNHRKVWKCFSLPEVHVIGFLTSMHEMGARTVRARTPPPLVPISAALLVWRGPSAEDTARAGWNSIQMPAIWQRRHCLTHNAPWLASTNNTAACRDGSGAVCHLEFGGGVLTWSDSLSNIQQDDSLLGEIELWEREISLVPSNMEVGKKRITGRISPKLGRRKQHWSEIFYNKDWSFFYIFIDFSENNSWILILQKSQILVQI